jgi:protein phosphatase
VQQDIGPIQLSHVLQQTTIELEDLPQNRQDAVEATINADDLADARRIIEALADARR